MLIVLFLVTFLLAFGISSGVARAGKEPIEGILHHFFSLNVTAAMSKYLRLAVVLIGISSGARIRVLEEYIGASTANKLQMTDALTQEFWVAELYRTAITTLEGILWLLLLFSFGGFRRLLDHAQVRAKAAKGFRKSVQVSRFQSKRGLATKISQPA